MFCNKCVVVQRSGTLYMWAIAGRREEDCSYKVLINCWQYSADSDYNESRNYFTTYSNIRKDCFTRYVRQTWTINRKFGHCLKGKIRYSCLMASYETQISSKFFRNLM
jgi:hypothetical protein